MMGDRTYRITAFVPLLGAFGASVWIYVLLYDFGFVSFVLFPGVRTFDFQALGTQAFFVVVVVPCLAAIGSLRIRVRLTDRGIYYRGFVRSGQIAWTDVSRITVPHKGFNLWIHGPGRRVNLTAWLVGQTGSLKEDICEYMQTWSEQQGG